MANITREYLENHIAAMRARLAEAQAQAAGYNGALQFAELLLAELGAAPEGDGLSVGEFAEMVGGPGATAEMTALDD